MPFLFAPEGGVVSDVDLAWAVTWREAVEDIVRYKAPELGGDAVRVLDSLAFLESLDHLASTHPATDGFTDAVEEAVEQHITRALGHDVTPGHDELHHYWTRGEGLAKWVDSPHQFTTLAEHLTKYVGPERAKTFAAAWVHEVTGFWPGSDMHRVLEGDKPRGHRIGPG